MLSEACAGLEDDRGRKMIADERGLELTTSSETAARHFDTAVQHYLKYKADTADWTQAMLTADPDFPMGHCVKGYLMMTAFDSRRLKNAGEALTAARKGESRVTAREKMHIAALDAWHRGALDEGFRLWDEILAAYPTDMLASRIAHFNHFWLGNAERLRGVVAGPLAKWSADMPGYGSMLAMLAFGHEECGEYKPAERAALQSLEYDRSEVWATHARAHVMEMQGRHREGADWLAGEEPYWVGANNIFHHLSWHRALFHLELGEMEAVLDCYDRKFRNLESPLVRAMPDLYIDVQNAASMLWRLERAGVDVGGRWDELAEKAMARTGDIQNLFTVPHFVMALAAAGRDADVEAFMAALQIAVEQSHYSTIPTVRDVAIPASAAAIAHRKGDHARVVALLAPIRGEIWRIGGSHAQRDLFTQMLLDSALKLGRQDVVRGILGREAKARSFPLSRRRGYAEAAEGHLQ